MRIKDGFTLHIKLVVKTTLIFFFFGFLLVYILENRGEVYFLGFHIERRIDIPLILAICGLTISVFLGGIYLLIKKSIFWEELILMIFIYAGLMLCFFVIFILFALLAGFSHLG